MEAGAESVEWKVIEVFAGSGEVLAGREAGKFPEVVIEMRLVIISAGESDLSPIDVALFVNLGEHVLEAPHAAEGLGREADLIMKKLAEAPVAEADVAHYARNSDPWE
jgi:hypothetical protein